MEKVLLDTNFLVYLIKEKKFRVFEDFLDNTIGNYCIYIFENSLAEIGNIGKRILKEVRLLIRNGKITLIKEKGKVDDLILKYKDEYLIATLDKELQKNLKRKIIKFGNYFSVFLY